MNHIAWRRPLTVAAALALLVAGVFVALLTPPAEAVDCARRYVAGGDHLPAGHDVSTTERFPNQLLDEKLTKSPGPWCLFNTAANGTTSSSYISGGQLAQSWNLRPDLITLTVGGENTPIVNLVTSCFDKVKDHDFYGANACAAAVLANGTAWTNLKNNLVSILNTYKTQMAGRPGLVVAVTGYPNPFPTATSAIVDMPLLCVPLIDTTLTCTARWSALPPALEVIDQAVNKLNATIKSAVEPFAVASQGRFVFVDVYPKMRDHCMKMDVSIKTTVYHGTYTDAHDSSRDFGCSDPWFVEGTMGFGIPTYLDPAATGVLMTKTQTTSGMGVHPDEDGADCISDLVWEAVKIKLGVPEPPATDVCT